jgi:hypothetical protein
MPRIKSLQPCIAVFDTRSANEKTLYVATQSRVAKTTLSIADLPKEGGEYILAFDVQPDGTVKNRRNFAKYEVVTQRPNGTPDVRFGGGTASRSTTRTACMRQRRRASRSSAHRASSSAPFPYRGTPTTWPLRVQTRRCTSSLAEQCTRSRCWQKGIRVGRNRRDFALPSDAKRGHTLQTLFRVSDHPFGRIAGVDFRRQIEFEGYILGLT